MCIACVHGGRDVDARIETKDGFRGLKKHCPDLQTMPHHRVKLGEHVLRGCEKS